MKQKATISIFSIVLISCWTCKPGQGGPYRIVQSAIAERAMVVSEHPLATEVGVRILRQGGNAVDAAVASQFALAVVNPRAGNLGGGGFMVIRLASGEAAALDYREKAPSLASRDMYLDSLGNVVDGLSQLGHLAVGVPGSVAGMEAAFERYSKLKDWKLLLQPAIDLAAKGFRITSDEAERLNENKAEFEAVNLDPAPFVKEVPWKTGDLLVQADLAGTLERIRDHGAAGFYQGETAGLIAREMERGGGLVTKDDLLNYEARWRTPVVGSYKGHKVISMPPPSSGGVALIQLLGLLEDVPLTKYGFQSASAVHAIVEAERRVYADRAKYLGDSDFHPVPVDSLLHPDYLASRMVGFSPDKATPSDSVQSGRFQLTVESFETTHTSIADEEGNAVAVTTTLNLNYGSKVIVQGAGFLLNDEMDDFSAKPGVPNYFGLVGAEANAIQPGKRMLSSMTPTIVEKDGSLHMVLGAPGGSTIITSVLQTMLNVIEYQMPADQAVGAPRFHHQWLPDVVNCEADAIDTLQRERLWQMGHRLRNVERMALMKAIVVLPDKRLHGAGDPRNPDDHAAGY